MKKAHKYIANLSMLSLENACIVMVQKEFSRTVSGKSWRAKPDSNETAKITAQNYFNY